MLYLLSAKSESVGIIYAFGKIWNEDEPKSSFFVENKYE